MTSKRKGSKFLLNIILLLLAGGLFGMGSVALWVATMRIPDLDSFEVRKVTESTKIYDKTGSILLYDVHDSIRRTVVPFEDISRNIKNATVAIEDSEFYQHSGIRPLSFLRAVLANIQTGSFGQGGSTITQQVVKNSLLTTEKRVSRKIKEWILAIKLERLIGKDEILAHYLNETPYGGNVYGVEEATQTFFGKRSSDITLAESAYVAALPQAPTYYSPYGNNREALDARKNLVLLKMLENSFISKEEYDEAIKTVVEFKAPEEYGIKAPHFVLFIKEQLEKKYGKEVVEGSGLKVISTLDYDLQKKAEEIVKKHALENKEKFNAENAGLIAIDPTNGNILAMVGSRDYFDKEIDGNFNITLAHRQPGSSFKPFVYATAFKKGYLPETVLFDVKTEFSTECNPNGTPITPGRESVCYMPENYDHVYRGPVSLRNALAQSINVPAIKTLYLTGINESLETARDFGISSLSNSDQYGLTLVLGGGEVSLLELSSAYGVFATGGIRNPYQSIISVTNTNGEVENMSLQNSRRVINESVALMISDVLSDNVARAPAFGENSYLVVPNYDVAVKTGTTNDYRDAWIVGYTPNLVVGSWAGNNDNSSMEKKVAGFIIAPLWNEFMTYALERLPKQSFPKPTPVDLESVKPQIRGVWQGNDRYVVDTISGKLKTEYTPKETQEERYVRNIHSILYWVDKKNPLGPPPENPQNDPQYKLWEYGVLLWSAERGLFTESTSTIPTAYDDVHGPQFEPKLTISGLMPDQQFEQNSRISVSIGSQGVYPLNRIDYFINHKLIGTVSKPPFGFSFTPRYVEGILSNNELLIVAHDSVKNKAEITIPFKINLGN